MTGMRLSLSLLVLLCGASGVAAPPEPQIDARLRTKGELWQGQRVVIEVTIKAPGTFASAPAFDLPKTSGVILVPPTGHPVLGTETIGDDSFTTQAYELTVFPQKSGDLTVPPFPIRFDSSAGFGKPAQSRTVTTPPISISIKRPPGTDGLQLVLTTTSLTIKDSWKPELSNDAVSPGTAWTRTIITQASDLPGIVLPAFHVDLPEGLRAYDHPPQLNDQENRGDLTGQRTETTTIVCERPGNYEIPAMTFAWWNPQEQKLHRETLPGHSVTVTAPPAEPQSDNAAADAKSSQASWWGLGIALAALAGGVSLYCLGPSIRRSWRERQARLAQSEPALFRTAVTACRSGDAHAAYRAILAWRAAIDPAGGEQTPGDGPLDADLTSELANLESSLYGPRQGSPAPSWSRERISRHLISSRHRWRGRVATSGEELPGMNP